MRKLQPIIDTIGSAAVKTRDLTRYWFSRLARLWLFLIAFAAVVSALAFFLLPYPRVRYYLEFPDALTTRPRGEIRYAPFHVNAEKAAEALCREILVGPESLKSRPLFSKDTKLRSVMLRGGTLFVDLSDDLALVDPPEGSYRESLAETKKLIKKNMISVRKVVLTVDGNETYADNKEEVPLKNDLTGGDAAMKGTGKKP
jgi:hypothetical protein